MKVGDLIKISCEEKMKVGDLIKSKNPFRQMKDKLFIVLRREMNPRGYEVVWIYPDPEAGRGQGYDHTDDDNYYFGDMFEVVSESR